MARNIDSIFTDLDIFAKNSTDKQAPPFAMNTGFGSAYDAGGGSFPERHSINNLLYRLYLTAELQTRYGGTLLWGTTIAYEKGAIVVSATGIPYFAKQTSTGVDPDTDVSETYWSNLIPQASNTNFRGSSGLVVATGNSVLLSGTANIKNQVTYSTPPTIDYTACPIYPTTGVMLLGNVFIDHVKIGQANTWQFEFTYDNPNKDAFISATFEQVDTGIKYSSTLQTNSETNTNAKFTATFNTISTIESIDTAKGYKLYVGTFHNNLNSIQLTKVSRFTTAAK